MEIYILTQDAISVYWFRLPLIRDLAAAGAHVCVLLPDAGASEVQAIKAAGLRLEKRPYAIRQ